MLRAQTLKTAIIERYRRPESSVEDALIAMYLAGGSVYRVEDITEAFRGHAGGVTETSGSWRKPVDSPPVMPPDQSETAPPTALPIVHC